VNTILRITACLLFALAIVSCDSSAPTSESRTVSAADESALALALARHSSDVQVKGEGTVTRLLPDDLNGRRHQRFIVRLASGQTLLITHNIDLAPRVEGLREGDVVRFNGEYVWNQEGGLIHWTHRDPEGRHVAGWVEYKGRMFQ
jgi:hypothetical protein